MPSRPRVPRVFVVTVLAVTAATAALSTAATASATPAPTAAPAHARAHAVRSSVHTCAQDVKPGHYTCFAERRSDVGFRSRASVAASPQATPNGYGPSSLQSAYNLPSATAGSGKRVYIVDAYDDPTAEADPRHLPQSVRAARVHDGERLLPEAEPERRAQPPSRGQHRLGG